MNPPATIVIIASVSLRRIELRIAFRATSLRHQGLQGHGNERPRTLMVLLHRVHSFVGFHQQLRGIVGIVREKRNPNADRQFEAAADSLAAGGSHRMNSRADLLHSLPLQTGSEHYKLVPTHARDVVVLTAGQLELASK